MMNLTSRLLKASFCVLLAAAASAACAQSDTPPIAQAAANGEYSRVVSLIDQGASPDSRGKDGATALMLAARNGHFQVVQALLIRGARKDLKDASGRTAYDYAVEKKALDVMALLRDAS